MEPVSPEPASPAEPKFPGVMMAAGIIWIIVGGLSLVGMLAVVISALVRGQDAWAAFQRLPYTPFLPMAVFFDTMLLLYGVQTVRGTPANTLGYGVMSIVIGLMFGSQSLVFQNGGVGGWLALVGLALLVAGILALVGRSDYKTWCKAHAARASKPAEPGAAPDRRP